MSYQRKMIENRRLKKLYQATKNWYGAGAYYDERKKRIIKYTCNSKEVRKLSSKIIRRKLNRTEDRYNGSKYKRLFDYWWTIT
ncbi:MAG: hypothetical protein IJH65_03620 [Methanobrevibacter sp.]|nr:hypothetical protein [Methanobrevibacter sp.]